jgi:serine protease Do
LPSSGTGRPTPDPGGRSIGSVRRFRDALAVTAAAALALTTHAAAAPEKSRRTPIVVAVERVRPAVVNISAEELVEMRPDPFFDEFFGRFFERQPGRRFTRTSLGSGVLVRADGYVVTNAHVVARGQKITVVLADEREFEARLVGTDEHSDLAVLRIDGKDLPHVEFGASDDLMIGETVVAIGNPFGFSHTVTTGVDSASGRSLRLEDRTYFDFIQTDASINPGNSGGPLLNIQGDLIGINTAIMGRAENIGFAIPAARASQITRELIQYGEVRLGRVGMRVQDLTPELAAGLDSRATRGVVVRELEPGGPAETAGVEIGDVVVAVDGASIRGREEFDDRLAAAGVGSHIRLAVQRGPDSREIELVAVEYTEADLDAVGWRRLGLRVREAAQVRAVEIAEVRPGSHALRAGLRPGDLLLAIGDQPIASIAAFRRSVGGLRDPSPAALTVQRGPRTYRLTLPGTE